MEWRDTLRPIVIGKAKGNQAQGKQGQSKYSQGIQAQAIHQSGILSYKP